MVISNLKLYTTAEVLAKIVQEEFEKADLHDEPGEAMRKVGAMLAEMATADETANTESLIEFLENRDYNLAIYYNDGKRYWYHLYELENAMDAAGEVTSNETHS